MSAPVLIEETDGVLQVTLNRPAHGNALDHDLTEALLSALDRAEHDARVRCVLLRGTGNMFCAGGNIDLFNEALDQERLGALLREVTLYGNPMAERLAQLSKPVVAAVHGPCAGGGFSLVLAADLVVAGSRARFVTAYAGLGFSSDLGISWYLPRTVGRKRSLDLLLTGRALDANEALEWGLVDRVVEDDQLRPAAEELATRLARGPTLAFAAIKRLHHEGIAEAFSRQLDLESVLMGELGATVDGEEGVRAFMARRPPRFQGR